MAQRRMFNKVITDSDPFLDMPATSQVLYFHLNMHADDDGFIGNTKSIMRMLGSSDDDLKLLIAKQFIIPFDSGVTVIRDWRLHNYIRKDRYQKTLFKAEQEQLIADEKGVYSLSDGDLTDRSIDGQPSGNHMATQVRLGKVRLGKDKEIDDDRKRVFDFFEQNGFGQITAFQIENMNAELNDFANAGSSEPGQMVIEGMKAALNSNSRRWKYAATTLHDWLDHHVLTIKDLEAYNKAHDARWKPNSQPPVKPKDPSHNLPY